MLCFGLYSVAQAQQTGTQSQKAPCVNASKITRDNDRKVDDGDVWTTETSSRDGVLSLTYCGVFKTGQATINRLAPKRLTEMPDGFESHRKYGELVGEKIRIRNLPVGYTVYKDMAFEIKTKAVPNMMYLTFRVPSVQSIDEFKKLRVLYLDEDGMLPGALQWEYDYRGVDVPEADLRRERSAPALIMHQYFITLRVPVEWWLPHSTRLNITGLLLNSA